MKLHANAYIEGHDAASRRTAAGIGFVIHERGAALERRLGGVATKLGGRHVRVHCQSLAANLVDVSSEAGSVQFSVDGVPERLN